MSSKKNSDKETFSLPKTVSLFGTQKASHLRREPVGTGKVDFSLSPLALQKLVDMRGEKQYNEANKEWLLTPITLAEGGLRKCGYFMQ